MTFNKKLVIALLAGFLLGVFWFIALRFVTFEDKRVHYHGNFALYINGVRDDFKSPTYYEETQSCTADEIGPKQRVHLHDQKPHVVHVHDEGSTWGHLFANLGYGLNNKSVQTDDGVFVDGDKEKSLTFILNGKKAQAIANEVIRSEDVLLISYGDEDDSILNSRFNQIMADADEYNRTNDPSSCSGSKPLTLIDRLRHSIGIN